MGLNLFCISSVQYLDEMSYLMLKNGKDLLLFTFYAAYGFTCITDWPMTIRFNFIVKMCGCGESGVGLGSIYTEKSFISYVIEFY